MVFIQPIMLCSDFWDGRKCGLGTSLNMIHGGHPHVIRPLETGFLGGQHSTFGFNK